MTKTNFIEVVASGPLVSVERWGRLLQCVRIGFEIRSPAEECVPAGSTYAELWVDHDRAERARLIIRRDADNDDHLLW